MTRLDDPFVRKQRRTITAYREEVARLKAINADLLEALKRVTESADLLAQELTDPGTEALAAIYCAYQTIAKADPSHD